MQTDGARTTDIVIAGTAGLVAGAMSMAAGEYVSVSAQADTEKAEIACERRELADDPHGELAELAGIYAARGVDDVTALAVATQLMAWDAIGAHTRDELDIAVGTRARPVQAAFASAASFTMGAAMPLLAVFAAPAGLLIQAVAQPSLFIPHGGGPCFFMPDPDHVWSGIARFLKGLVDRLPEPPRAVIMVFGIGKSRASPSPAPDVRTCRAKDRAAGRPAGDRRTRRWSQGHAPTPRSVAWFG